MIAGGWLAQLRDHLPTSQVVAGQPPEPSAAHGIGIACAQQRADRAFARGVWTSRRYYL
jgi:hypothetical protein